MEGYLSQENSSDDEEENQNVISDTNADAKEFFLQFSMSERLFVTQTSGHKHPNLEISFDTIEEFREQIWESVVHLLKKEIIVKETEPKYVFAENDPTIDDFDKFLSFAHPAKKAAKAPTELRNINSWKDKVMRLYIHPYSTVITSKPMYDQINKILIEPYEKDRAGACSNSYIDEIIEELKEIHEERYAGFDINWRLWATYITNSEAHLREQLKQEDPPQDILRSFASRPNLAERILNSNSENLTVGTHINDDVRLELLTMKPALERIQQAFEEVTRDFNELKNRFSRLMTATETRRELLRVIPNQQAPREMESSSVLSQNVEDCPDVDHN